MPINDEPAFRPSTPATIEVRTLLRIVGAIVGVLVVAGAAWFGWQQYSEHKTTERTNQIAAQTLDGLQEYVRNDSGLSTYKLLVKSVDLNKVSDTKYEGMATVTVGSSTAEHLVKLEVNTYGDRMSWETEPGAFLFLAQQQAPGWGS